MSEDSLTPVIEKLFCPVCGSKDHLAIWRRVREHESVHLSDSKPLHIQSTHYDTEPWELLCNNVQTNCHRQVVALQNGLIEKGMITHEEWDEIENGDFL
jgi:hypothetical protein